jgi:hypothetical protein
VGTLVAGILGLPGDVGASTQSSFVSFSDFIADMTRIRYNKAIAARRVGAVSSAAAFEEMRAHVLKTYRGVRVAHSYRVDEGYFDCVTVESQPGVRAAGVKAVTTPPSIVVKARAGDAKEQPLGAASPLTLGLKDAHGNAISCPPGTIPMRRISLDRLTRFATLKTFLAKGPDGLGQAPASDDKESKARAQNFVRHYAYGNQWVGNHGGQSSIGLYNPAADFSISQQWYVSGSGGGTQTVEGGWIKYPQYFGANSVTFVYFTADNYATTGCYNLDCPGFIQINRNWPLGGGWSAYSTPGGPQYQFTMQWQWYQGNWWLFLQGGGAMEAVGYYPGHLYRGGPLGSYAERASFGGETMPTSAWPPMGSGYHAAHGWGWAAFQHTIFTMANGVSTWAALDTYQTAPACYTIAYTPASAGWSWGTFFYFGGPGGWC